MPLAVTAATTGSAPAGAIIAAAVLVTVGYIVACVIWPFTGCARCDGKGKFRSPSGRAWRKCRRCKGSGTRVRHGRRVWTYLHRK